MKHRQATHPRPGINYPWLLAIAALVTLGIHKASERKAPSLPEAAGPPSEPVIEDRLLIRAKVGDTTIGNAFAAAITGHPHPVVLTAMHRFGPAGGLMRVPGATTIAASSSDLTLLTTAGEPIATPSLSPLDLSSQDSPRGEDLAAFSTPGAAIQPAPLSTVFPTIGSTIWLAIPGENGAATTLRSEIFAADPMAGLFYFRLPEDSLDLAGANRETGAPILDLNGDVLGVHVGAAEDSPDFPPFGLALGTATFLPQLRDALEIPTEQSPVAAAEPSAP